MTFSRRQFVILGASILGAVALSVGIVMVVNSNPTLQNTVTKLANIPTTTNTNSVVPLKNTNTSSTNAEIIYVARAFTERFGTTNNQQPDVILAAVPYTTATLEQTIRTNVTAASLQPAPSTLLTIITTARVFHVAALTTITAQVTVGTTREQRIGDKTTTFQQDLRVDLALIGATWKVSAASWRPQ